MRIIDTIIKLAADPICGTYVIGGGLLVLLALILLWLHRSIVEGFSTLDSIIGSPEEHKEWEKW